MLNFCLIAEAEVSSLQNCDIKTDPLSEMISSGVPKKRKTFLRYNSASCLALQVLLHAINNENLLNLSFITKIASNPQDLGKPVLKSIEIDFQGCFGGSRNFKRPIGF